MGLFWDEDEDRARKMYEDGYRPDDGFLSLIFGTDSNKETQDKYNREYTGFFENSISYDDASRINDIIRSNEYDWDREKERKEKEKVEWNTPDYSSYTYSDSYSSSYSSNSDHDSDYVAPTGVQSTSNYSYTGTADCKEEDYSWVVDVVLIAIMIIGGIAGVRTGGATVFHFILGAIGAGLIFDLPLLIIITIFGCLM